MDEEKYYTAYGLSKILSGINRSEVGVPRIESCAIKESLYVSVEESGIDVGKSNAKRFIPRSRLVELMDALGMDGTLKDIEEQESFLEGLPKYRMVRK